VRLPAREAAEQHLAAPSGRLLLTTGILKTGQQKKALPFGKRFSVA
jgi:hypothetical protein